MPAKRQKCSGSKPQCDQCRMHNEECWWSDQKKRGPAKDYLRSLQDRLQETERLLLGVLPHVPDEVLGAVLQQPDGVLAKIPYEHWSRFRLNRLDHIREWQNYHANGPHRPSPQSNQPASKASIPDFSEGTRTSVASLGMASEQHDSIPRQTSTSSEWQRPRSATPRLDERRYSEETRDACEALFSISNPRPAPETKRAEYAPPENTSHPYPATADSSSLPSQFPKHLFW